MFKPKKPKFNTLLAIAVCAPFFFCNSVLRADTIFNNITGRDDSGGSINFYTQIWAVGFTPNTNYTLTGVSAFLVVESATLSIDSTQNGVPGAQLATFAPIGNTGFEQIFTASHPSTSVPLQAGDEYWLVIASQSPGLILADGTVWNGGWFGAGSSSAPAANSSNGGLTWTTPGSSTLEFAIDGDAVTPTPEPSTSGLFAVAAIGSFGAIALRRRYRYTVRASLPTAAQSQLRDLGDQKLFTSIISSPELSSLAK